MIVGEEAERFGVSRGYRMVLTEKADKTSRAVVDWGTSQAVCGYI